MLVFGRLCLQLFVLVVQPRVFHTSPPDRQSQEMSLIGRGQAVHRPVEIGAQSLVMSIDPPCESWIWIDLALLVRRGERLPVGFQLFRVQTKLQVRCEGVLEKVAVYKQRKHRHHKPHQDRFTEWRTLSTAKPKTCATVENNYLEASSSRRGAYLDQKKPLTDSLGFLSEAKHVRKSFLAVVLRSDVVR